MKHDGQRLQVRLSIGDGWRFGLGLILASLTVGILFYGLLFAVLVAVGLNPEFFFAQK